MTASWTANVQPSGIISSLSLDLAFDSGCTDGAGGPGDLGMAIHWSDNSYRHADFSCAGRILRSSTVGATACRAPGVVCFFVFVFL